MADENSAPGVPQDDDSTKKETIRITLPPKGDQPGVKRETVRIAVPGAESQALGSAPKKETSKVQLPPPQSEATPPPFPSPGNPPTKPLSSAVPPPKPPPLTGKATVPLKPAAPRPSGLAPAPTVTAPLQSGGSAKPASPKKETARINLPSEAPKSSAPALPRATVKMQQTQPLSRGPTSGIRSQPLSSTSQVVAAPIGVSTGKPDTLTIVLSVLVFLVAGTSAYFAYTVYDRGQLPIWVTNPEPPYADKSSSVERAAPAERAPAPEEKAAAPAEKAPALAPAPAPPPADAAPAAEK